MRRLLFLNGIKAFEAAARSGSFAGAGLELNVSAAAISRMVNLLEQRLGVALFERKANRLAMTAAGRAYQSGLTPIFDALASLTAQVTAPSSVRVLTIGVGPTFAMRWLIPRLADFRKSEPDIEVRITTGGKAAPFADDWSCGVQLGDGAWPDLVAEPLFAADLLPVCTPRLAMLLKRPGDLKGPSLLRVAQFARRLAALAQGRRRRAGDGARTGTAILRPGAAGGQRRIGRRDGHPALHRRRSRRRTPDRAVPAIRAEGDAMVSGLSQLPHRPARFRRLPALDYPRRGRLRRSQATPIIPDSQNRL
jgi:DNA-binding transcriptional LysR family regulator